MEARQMNYKYRCILSVVAFLAVGFIHCSKITDPEPEPESIVSLLNSEIPKGKHTIMWDQKDKDKNQVSDGNYRAVLGFENYNKYADFNISSQNDHVPIPKGIVIFPHLAPISVNSETYATGDTVCIYFNLDDKQYVELSIEKY